MKKLPIGKQDLVSLMKENCIYVDKTKIIHQLITTGFAYFLSRPRRFGKSLLVSTLQEIFAGNKELFKGLWIYDNYDFKPHPVIRIDFSEISKRGLSLEDGLNIYLDEIARKHSVSLTLSHYGLRFRELIKCLSTANAKVVVLIDEYDKPIIDNINDVSKAKANRDLLKDFFSILKGSDEHIQFLILTGVSKFSKVSIFSDLNHLNDITLDSKYAKLLGYTFDELEQFFPEYMALANKEFGANFESQLKKWYNGYSWNGSDFVYNPFSILNFFSKIDFQDYWFSTGTPTFLVELLRNRNLSADDYRDISVRSNILDKYEIENMETIPLLFQTGYITIKDYDNKNQRYMLSYPNKEVENSFEQMMLASYTSSAIDSNSILANRLLKALDDNDFDKFFVLLKSLYKNITYPNIDDKEKYYHTIFYLVLKMLGMDISSEIITIDGRIDAVLKTKSIIYIIEFKMGTAKSALEQIKQKLYHQKYAMDNKKLFLMGVGFDIELKNIGEFLIEEIVNG